MLALIILIAIGAVASAPLSPDEYPFIAVTESDNRFLFFQQLQAIKDLPLDELVQFQLFTRKNKANPQILCANNTDSLRKSNYNHNNPTTIIIHGFLSDAKSDLVTFIKQNLLNVGENNVIAVDWSQISKTILYTVAAEETRAVGKFVGSFVNMLIKEGTGPESIHIIGHSLGAHIAGFAGGSVKGKMIARITGLDPAKPSFENLGPKDRLDATDAEFVDCIHTDAGELGIETPICSADFYPNGGTNTQPGCPWYDLVGQCSHGRSYYYYAESIKPGHLFKAKKCSKVPLDGPKKICKKSKAVMGAPASSKYLGLYYVGTNDASPYAKN